MVDIERGAGLGQSRDDAILIVDSPSPSPSPERGGGGGAAFSRGLPKDAIVIDSDEEEEDSFVVADFRPSGTMRIDVDDLPAMGIGQGRRRQSSSPPPLTMIRRGRGGGGGGGGRAIDIDPSGSPSTSGTESEYRPSPDDSAVEVQGSSNNMMGAIWDRVRSLPSDLIGAARSMYEQLEQERTSSQEMGGPVWMREGRQRQIEMQQQMLLAQLESDAATAARHARQPYPQPGPSSFASSILGRGRGRDNAAPIQIVGDDDGQIRLAMPGAMVQQPPPDPNDPDMPGVGVEDMPYDIELNESVNEMLGQMVEGNYRGADAMAQLYGDEGVDVGRLPLYSDEAGLRRRGLRTRLHDHQLQGVQWMVKAEHRRLTEREPVAMWKTRKDANGRPYYVNVADPTWRQRQAPVLPRGGINADAMGLGKTLQVIALALADRNRVPKGRRVVYRDAQDQDNDEGNSSQPDVKKIEQQGQSTGQDNKSTRHVLDVGEGQEDGDSDDDEYESHSDVSQDGQTDSETEPEPPSHDDADESATEPESGSESESDGAYMRPRSASTKRDSSATVDSSEEGNDETKVNAQRNKKNAGSAAGAKRKRSAKTSHRPGAKKSKSASPPYPESEGKCKSNGTSSGKSSGKGKSRATSEAESKPNGTTAKKDKLKYNEATLVVCPLSVLQNWAGQVQAHCSHRVKFYTYYDANAKRMRGKKGAVEHLGTYNFVFTTYDTLRSEYKIIEKRRKAREERDKQRQQRAESGASGGVDDDEDYVGESSSEAVDKRGKANGRSKGKAKAKNKKKGTDKGKARKRSASVDSFLASAEESMDEDSDELDSDDFEDSDDSDHDEDDDYGSDDSFVVNDVPRRRKKPKKQKTKTPLLTTRWRRVVLDEAHICRNPKTALYRSICEITAQRRWALTGTPIVNSTRDLGSLASWCGLDPFADAGSTAWKKKIEDRLRQGRSPGGRQVAAHLLKAVVRSIVIRRHKSMKDAVGADIIKLPKVTFYKHTIPMKKSDRDYYEKCEMAARARVEGWIAGGELAKFRGAVFLFLLRLRQLSCSRRLVPPALLEDIESRDWTEADAIVPGSNLSSDDIKRLQEKLLVAVQMNDDCPVCMEPLLGRDPIITHCAHPFCRACIVAVLSTSGAVCPMDRRPLPPVDKLIGLPPENETKENTPDPDADYDDDDDDDDSDGIDGARSAKIRECLNIIRMTQKRDPTEKILVFSNFVKFLNLIAEALKAEMVEFCRFDGGMDVWRRDAVRDRFAQPITPSQAAKVRTNVTLQERRREEKQQQRIRAKEEAKAAAKKEEEESENQHATPTTSQKSTFLDSLRQIKTTPSTSTSTSTANMKNEKGKKRQKERKDADDVFGQNPSVMLISMGCGSLGLNLTAASTVIMMDPWWQSSIEQQAIDRVHRIGQERDIRVFQMISKESVEDRVLQKQAEKEEMAMEAFSGLRSRGQGETARQKHETSLRDLATLLGVDRSVANLAQSGPGQ